MIRRVIRIAIAVLIVAPAHATTIFTCTGGVTSCSIDAGTFTSPASVNSSEPFFTATNAGTFNVTSSANIQSAMSVLSISTSSGGSSSAGATGFASSGFQFTNAAPIIFTSPEGFGTQTGLFQAVLLQSQGNNGSAGEGGGSGGDGGPLTATFTSGGVNTTFGSVTGGTYGIRAETTGGNGGGTTKNNLGGGSGGVAGTLSLSLSGVSVNTSQANNPGAAILMRQTGGAGGSAQNQSNATGGAGGQVNALSLTINGGGASIIGSNLGGSRIAAVDIQQTGGSGGALGDSSGGGQGGSAGPITISLTNAGISALGGSAMVVTQVGGTGGLANTSSTGGTGGSANPIDVTVTDSYFTSLSGGVGLALSQTGGRGGDGDSANARDFSNGGKGATAGGIALQFTAAQSGSTASGNDVSDAPAILAQSTGGAGGIGATTGGGLQSFVGGGNGGTGALGGAVSISSTGILGVTTQGTNSPGLAATSTGGAGGNAGELTFAEFGTAGIGGAGGSGGIVTVNLASGFSASTTGTSSPGVVAMTVGGRGGAGGQADGNTGATGGVAGAGGPSGSVSVTLAGGTSVKTTGDRSAGLLVQSIGGQGGDGGEGSGGLATGTGGGGGAGGAAGSGTAASVVTAATISTKGQSSVGILVQAIAGGGGNGGLGTGTGGTGGAGGGYGSVAPITVTNTGSVTTLGDGAHALLVHSIAGGGGTGGEGSGFSANPGAGGSASDGGSVTVTHGGSVSTSGDTADGVLAQSIGGGGGTGGVGQGIFYSDGGSGAAGGNGGVITVTVTGSVATSGTLSAGVNTQSIGGGGGNGGNVTNASAFVTVAVGGSAGAGGSGGTAGLTLNGATVTTTGSGAMGAILQSVGGGGGTGGAAYGISVGTGVDFGAVVGGNGGVAGNGGTVTLSATNTRITTSGAPLTVGSAPPVDAHGLVAQSVGGGGGVGGGASAYSVVISRPTVDDNSQNITATYSAGGAGGAGGDGGQVLVNLGAGTSVTTSGDGAIGVATQSIGGGGGNGGDSSIFVATVGSTNKYVKIGGSTDTYTINLAVGGDAGGGGTSDSATLNLGATGTTNAININTTGDYATGLAVQSIGGGGGIAGAGSANVYSTGNTSTIGITYAVGANGGVGGAAGAATANIYPGATIRTTGSSSPGLVVHSIGGGGGIASGSVLGVGALSGSAVGPTSIGVRGQIGVGQQGGSGNTAGVATVLHQGSITTIGNDSPGIIVQSIGGGGGIGGTPGTDPAMTAGTGAPAPNPAAGVALDDPVLGGPTVNIRFNLSLNVGGQGGTGGLGNAVNVTQQGMITTSGDYSPGISAQSIGGGGGKGGVGVAGSESNSLKSIAATLYVNSTISLGMSGSGGGGNDGGTVTVGLGQGAIVTGLAGQGSAGSGWQSFGVLAQSVGGGGGVGADGTATPGGIVYLGADIAGGGGSAGDGKTVTINQTGSTAGTITTYGGGAHAILAQSVGGGGGIAGSGGAVLAGTGVFSGIVTVSLGGRSNGTSGSGGAVLVDFPGPIIVTDGDSAYGILAQSIGGGGGLAAISAGATPSVAGLGGSGAKGDGGSVTANLSSAGSITTTGIAAHGIVAQSVGGGGGIIILPPALVNALPTPPSIQADLPPAIISAGSGIGGAVTVQTHGPINVSGAGAIAILAQSASNGGGIAYLDPVNAGTPGAVFIGATGVDTPPTAAGSVTIVTQGAITASGVNGVGILAQSAGSAQSVSSGTISVHVQGGLSGNAITGGSGGQGAGIWVMFGNAQNSILIDGGSTVSAASGLAINYSGSFGVQVTNNGTIVGSSNVGSGTVTNAATLVVAGPTSASRPYFGTSVINGNFVQTATGRITLSGDFVNGRAGRLIVNGNAMLDGTVQPTLLSIQPGTRLPVLEVNGTITGHLTVPSSALFGYGIGRSGNILSLEATSANFNPPGFALASSRAAVASHLQAIWDRGGSATLGPLFAFLGTVADQGGSAAYSAQLRQLSPDSGFAPGARGLANTHAFSNNAMSCPQFAGTTAMLTEGQCGWMRVTGRSAGQDSRNGITNYNYSTVTWQIGGQYEIAPNWFLGGSMAYETSSLSTSDRLTTGKGQAGYGALVLKYQTGPWLFAAAALGAAGQFDSSRTITLPGYGGVAKGNPDTANIGTVLRATYTIGREEFYLRHNLTLSAIHTRTGAYQETGGGSLNLAVNAASQTTLMATPMLELGGRIGMGDDMVLRPYVAVGVSFLSNNSWKQSGRLMAAPPGTSEFATSIPVDPIAGRVSTGVQLYTGRLVDFRLQYDGDFSATTTAHAGSLVASLRF